MSPIELSSLTIKKQGKSTGVVYAEWSVKTLESKIEKFLVQWQYAVSGEWFNDTTNEVDAKTTKTYWNNLYTVPNNATKIRVSVKPISKTYTRYGQEYAYFEETWFGNLAEPNSRWLTVNKADLKKIKSSSAPKPEKKSVDTVKIEKLLPNSNTLIARWTQSIASGTTEINKKINQFTVEWWYSINGNWFSSGTSTVAATQTVSDPYDPDDRASIVQVRVRPEPNTYEYTKDGESEDVAYFEGKFSTFATYNVPDTPETPTAPEASIKNYNLTARVDTYDKNTTYVQFELVSNDGKVTKTAGSIISKVEMSTAKASFSVSAGITYKVRCRGINGSNPKVNEVSEWSEYSSEVSSKPKAITVAPTLKALSASSIEVKWVGTTVADSYNVQYTQKLRYFDASPEQVKSQTIEDGTTFIATGLDAGEWIFRVQVADDSGNVSEWSKTASITIGKAPNPPTTWSSTASAIMGRDVILYWTHNSEDGSRERSAKLELDENGTIRVIDIANDRFDDEDVNDSGTYSYVLDTTKYEIGATIKWRVKTQGVVEGLWSDWSTQRVVDIYLPPSLVISIGYENNWWWDYLNFPEGSIHTALGDLTPLVDGILTSYPLYIRLDSAPLSQTPVTYNITIKANNSYTDTDDLGNPVYVAEGQQIFSRNYDVSDHHMLDVLGAEDINLGNGASYLIIATVAMDSGLIAEAEAIFSVSWEEEDFYLEAEIAYDEDTITTYITPYCNADENDDPIDGMTLGVYRRDFDGNFVEIAKGLSNDIRPTVTDPHPALNYARYRITGKSEKTGKVSFYDVPAYPIGVESIVIQWDEAWSSFDVYGEDAFVDRPWSGSMLKLPYNIDISDSNEIAVEFSEYIGRRHPVSYYGTQVGQISTWNTVIEADDTETLYALRRLSVYMGDAYVREPSGTGYWAQIKVSYNINHTDRTIPVTLSIKRVEGGL